MPTDIPPITYGTFYHIYNRGNNRENIFFQERNYDYFLNLWWKHISPIAETWAYCLLRNHFHAVVYIKDRADLTGLKSDSANLDNREVIDRVRSNTYGDLSGLKPASQYFSNFFNAYARGAMQSIASPLKEPAPYFNGPLRGFQWAIPLILCG